MLFKYMKTWADVLEDELLKGIEIPSLKEKLIVSR